ncbi:MAG: glycosyl hydrolase 53 family protein [Clostridiales bacterium]|nr:glycosyl hydrolase 53 family protein [Clostridiales bacterium]
MKTNKLSRLIISLLLCLAMAFSFVACSTRNSTGGGATPDDSGIDSVDIASVLALDVGGERKLQVTLMPFGAQATVTWRTSDASIATVSSEGVVKGIAQGKAIVRASVGSKSADCVVTVTDRSLLAVDVLDVSFNIGTKDLEVGETYTLTATIEPEDATDKTLIWKSSNTDVATISKAGVVTAVAPGTANITATANNGAKATCVIVVKGDVAAVSTLHVRKIDALEGRDDFIMGMDASAVPSLEAAGVEYKDFDGEVKDVYKILADNGITDIRIRIWNDPYQSGHSGELAYSYGGGNCDVNNAVAIAKRCKQYGLGVIIDFHYSDFWADPGKQKAPKAWKDKSVAERKTAIYEFTKESLEAIKETGVKITMVQIGNETTGSICEASYGSAPADYCAYINQGSKAVREVTGKVADGGAKVAIHLTNPESRDFVGYANTFKNNNVDYDVFGTSYYPFWHGTLDNLATKLKDVNKASGKQVMVLETSYAFTEEDFDGTGNTQLSTKTKPFTVQGQSNAVLSVIETIAKLGNYGLGVCYWEGTWVAPADNRADTLELCNKYGCGWASAKAGPSAIGGDGYQAGDVTSAGGVVIDNQAFFRSFTGSENDGMVLDSLKVFKYAKTGLDAPPVADYIYAEEIFCTVDVGTVTLPDKITVVLNDDSVLSVDALWAVDVKEVAEYIHKVDDYVITGTTPFGGTAVCTVYVQNKNLLIDGSFEDSTGYGSTDNFISVPEPWKVEHIATKHVLQLFVSNDASNAKMGKQSMHFWDDAALEFRLYQVVDIAAAVAEYGYGIFSFSVDFAGGDCGATQDIYSYAYITYKDGTTKEVKGSKVTADGWQKWSRSAVDEIVIDDTVSSVSVGIYLKAEANGWGNIDNAQFFFRSPAKN